jgi:hypothetical protein
MRDKLSGPALALIFIAAIAGLPLLMLLLLLWIVTLFA